MFTRPNEIVPFQMERMDLSVSQMRHVRNRTAASVAGKTDDLSGSNRPGGSIDCRRMRRPSARSRIKAATTATGAVEGFAAPRGVPLPNLELSGHPEVRVVPDRAHELVVATLDLDGARPWVAADEGRRAADVGSAVEHAQVVSQAALVV
jgi:hypothetical protein